MNQVAENHSNRYVSPDSQPPPDSEGHPVREWIDTLLQAAVIAKDKQKDPTTIEVEVPFTDATSSKDAGGLIVANAATITAASETAAAVAAGTKAKGVNQEAKNETEITPSPDAKDASLDTIVETKDPDNASHSVMLKRYCRRRCEVEGCSKFARFNNACSGHGGRRLCAELGCERVAQFGHKCGAHGGVKFCSVEGCRRAVQSRGCCKTHGGGVRCQHPDCKKGAISKGFCRSHGGGSRCAQQGCQKWAQRLGYCVRHSKLVTNGDTRQSQLDLNVSRDATISLLQTTQTINAST